MEIDEEILNKTTDCDKDFHCIKTSNHILCKVEDCLNNKVLFVKCLNRENCPYKMPFGKSFICNCPTRKEIFNKYGV